jgi:hypothetical protein
MDTRNPASGIPEDTARHSCNYFGGTQVTPPSGLGNPMNANRLHHWLRQSRSREWNTYFRFRRNPTAETGAKMRLEVGLVRQSSQVVEKSRSDQQCWFVIVSEIACGC